MQPTISDMVQTSTVTQPQQHQSPSHSKPSPASASSTGAARAHTATEDYVTLSSFRADSSDPATRRKPSQPVSGNEKKALLNPNSPQYSFSVYG